MSMIPKGWRKAKLAQLATGPISYGVVQTGTAIKGGVPCVRVVDLASGKLSPEGMITTDPAISESYRRTVLKAGDVMIALRGIIGRAVRVPARLEGCNLTRGIARVAPDPGLVESDFLVQLLNGPDFQGLINRQANGSALQEISIATLRAAPILLPPHSEQRQIADVLSTWDRAIETVEALIVNAGEQKAELMSGLLTGRVRLPGFSGEWTEIILGQAFAERLERGDDDLALLSVTQSSGIIPQGAAGRRNISSADQSNYKTVRAGDIAYNTMRMWQGASAVSSLTGKVSPAYTVVTPREGHDAAFYGYLFKKPDMIHIFERHSKGLVSDSWNLKFPLFAKIPICAPGFEEQRAIAKVIRVADDLVRQRQAQLDSFRQEKAALMQQLLTGQRRVSLSTEATLCPS